MYKNYFVLALLLLSVHDTLTVNEGGEGTRLEVPRKGSRLEQVKKNLGLITPTRTSNQFFELSEKEDMSTVQFRALQKKTRKDREKMKALEEQVEKMRQLTEQFVHEVHKSPEGGSIPSSPELLKKLSLLLKMGSSDEELKGEECMQGELPDSPVDALPPRDNTFKLYYNSNLHYDSPCGFGQILGLHQERKNPYSALIPFDWDGA